MDIKITKFTGIKLIYLANNTCNTCNNFIINYKKNLKNLSTLSPSIRHNINHKTMKEFVLIFRTSKDPHANPSPEQVQARINWMAAVTAQNKLADKGNRLAVGNAKTVRPGNIITDGPYKDTEEFISGYMVVRTATIEEAIELAKTNPILRGGGNIEVRAVI
jgi:hypothetical protein